MKIKKPKKIKELAWRRAGNLFLLVDEKTKKTYSLDPIAFMVWVQCDGKTDLEAIVDIFSVDGNRDIVRAAIIGILKRLCNSGLVKWG